MIDFDFSRYLDRIGLASVSATASGLAGLQTAQLRRVTFENIDPLLGIEPDVGLSAIFQKVVLAGRGGYCFELNTLIGAALAALGIPAQRTLARVRMGAAEGGRRSHLAWIAEVEGRRFLVDAGFGGPGPLEPLMLNAEAGQTCSNGVYRLRPDPVTGDTIVERLTRDGWFALYGFDEAHVIDADVAAANHLCAKWSDSPFPRHLMLNGYDGATRIGIFDRSLTEETAAGRSTRRDFANMEDFGAALTGRLGLRLDHPTLEAVWHKIGLRHGGSTTADDGFFTGRIGLDQ